MKKATLLVLSFVCAQQLCSQDILRYLPRFQHVDVGFTTGTLGIGLEVATPVTDFMDVRTGFTYVPHFEVNMDFPIQVIKNGKPDQESFNYRKNMMKRLTGYEVDDHVEVIGEPHYSNFKFLLDFKPLRDKHWFFTAGFYLGGRNIARAYNTTEEMPSLFAVRLFNRIRDTYINNGTIDILGNNSGFSIDPELGELLKETGEMGIQVGYYTHPVLYSENVYNTEWVMNDDKNPDNPQNYDNGGPGYEAGELILHKANDPDDPLHKVGDPYLMQPDENSMVKARIRVNSFRPYLGFGYGGRLLKKDDRYHVHFECGALFWGGTPAIITHDGTNLSKDVERISGKVGDYVDFFSSFKVYPVLSLRLTRRF